MSLTTTESGPPHGPEGEKHRDMPAMPGKQAPPRSPSAPNGAPSSTSGCSPEPPSSSDSCAPTEPKTITRVTGKIVLDPRDAAEHPELHRQRDANKKRLCGGPTTCSACRLYTALDDAGRVVVRAMNAATRKLWQMDGAALDAFLARGGRGPKGKEWPFPNVEGSDTAPQSAMYRYLRQIAPGLASGLAATLSDKVISKWQETRYDALVREIKAPPHYKRGFPVPIRAQSFTLRRIADGEDPPEDGKQRRSGARYLLGFSLAPGRHPGGAEFRIPIVPRDGYQARLLRQLTDGRAPDTTTIKIGEAKIAEDKRHPGKWLVSLSYTRLAEANRTGEITAGINRGVVCFLTAVASTGERWLYDGFDIEAGLKRFQARRKRYQRDAKASGRDGHGRARVLRPIGFLEAKGERGRAAKCQMIARRFGAWLGERGVSRLYMEDFSGIRDGEPEKLEGGKAVWDRIQEWPYYQLGTKIASCCAEVGIVVEERPALYISQRCSRCGYTAKENVDLQRRLMTCQQCRFRMFMDANAAENCRQDGERARDEQASRGARGPEGGGSNGQSGGGVEANVSDGSGGDGPLAGRGGRWRKGGSSGRGGGNGRRKG